MSPENWEPVGGLELEPTAAETATSIEGNFLVAANPGSGKTELLAQRADFLLRCGVCKYPRRILAISFKVDASVNLSSRVNERCGQTLAGRFDSYTFHAFALSIIRGFRLKLPSENFLDPDFEIADHRVGRSTLTFDDLLPFALSIIDNSEVVRRSIRATYSDVFLDEFQDCNPQQYELIKKLFCGSSSRLVAVGDNNQLIMTFARASEKTFGFFIDDFGAEMRKMFLNRRSEPRLLRFQNSFLESMDPSAMIKMDQLKGSSGELFISRFATCSDEAKAIAQDISSWIDSDKIPPSEIAILIRQQTAAYGWLIFKELAALGIPFRDEFNHADLASEPLTRILVDCLLVVSCSNEPEAYTRLSQQLEGLSRLVSRPAESEARFNRIISQRLGAETPKNASSKLEISFKVLDELIEEIGDDRIIALSKSYESKIYRNTLVERLKNSLQSGVLEQGSFGASLNALTDEQSVRVLTIHKCKGLEFHSVIVVGVEDELYWGDSSVADREFFVAISRAKKRLVLTSTFHRTRPDGFTKRWSCPRSETERFLLPAEEHLSCR